MTKNFLSIQIEINHHCNLACTYCPNSNHQRMSQGFMAKESFEHIMRELDGLKYAGSIQYHFYNEPLLHPKLEEFIRISKSILPQSRSEIFTNGVLLSHDKFVLLRDAGVDKFVITRHAQAPKIPFDDFEERSSEAPKTTVILYNHERIIHSSRGGLVNVGKKIDRPLSRTCMLPHCNPVITLKGNVLPCYEDYYEKNILGNVFDKSLESIWKSEAFATFRSDLKNGKRCNYEVCSTCNNIQVI